MSRLAPPPAPAAVQAVLDAMPAAPRAYLGKLRDLIRATAAKTPGVGPLTETLKWGEPAFLTNATKSGTTLRLGWKPAAPDTAQLLVPCSTTLVNEWRDLYSGTLAFSGTRAIDLDLRKPLPEAALSHCIAMALTYHARKHAR
ncbi:MAG: hypothetical protein VR74_19000 [Hyphomonas sp. BRH_c22]|uniref:DUF1801 domain-containing protein n=1 Tax=Hyphomonas sp. BRH_c22 TaxID=1629710 RepID=UPI0005F1AF1B|nr:DUF1801 domain-containing protein [Hyphomonas sp. BRH_c22]KJS34758.1 MAG: hypothetical protein VR74_19000 [Hyphomonas sp. BRH_c22]